MKYKAEGTLPYSLKHQQNHERCKELYPEGFKYVSSAMWASGPGNIKTNNPNKQQ